MSVGKRCKDLLFFAPRFFFVVVFMGLIVAMVLSNFDLLEPYLYPLHAARGRITPYGENITIGHYPHMYELERLKKERNIDLDVSLLNNSLPQERVLNDLLVKRTQKLGIGFKSVSFNYFDLDGAENKARMAELIDFLKANSSRKVYIHCYLGRHRVKKVHDELVKQGLIREPARPRGA